MCFTFCFCYCCYFYCSEISYSKTLNEKHNFKRSTMCKDILKDRCFCLLAPLYTTEERKKMLLLLLLLLQLLQQPPRTFWKNYFTISRNLRIEITLMAIHVYIYFPKVSQQKHVHVTASSNSTWEQHSKRIRTKIKATFCFKIFEILWTSRLF